MDTGKLSTEQLEKELAKRKQNEADKINKKKKEHYKKKEDFLKETNKQFNELHVILKDLKNYAILEANQIWKEMYEIEGKEPKEQKRITVKNDKFKVVVEHRDKFEFTDEAAVHIDAIKVIFKEKFELRNKGMYAFLDTILMKNGAGDYDPKLLSKAKRKAEELGYDDLIAELEKLQKCQTVTGTSKYCRVFQKNKHGSWEDIVLQFSAL